MASRYRTPHRIRKKRSRLQKAGRLVRSPRFWKAALLAVLVALAGYGAAFSSFVQLQRIAVSGNASLPAEELKETAEPMLAKNLWLVQTRSMLFLDTGRAERELRERFPKLEEVRLDRHLFQRTLEMKVTERGKVAVWCANEQCFSVDRHGILFESASPQDTPRLLVGGKGTLGEKIVAPDKLREALELNEVFQRLPALRHERVELETLEFAAPGRINATTSEGWSVYFNPLENQEWQRTKLHAVLQDEIGPERRKQLEYIDLRFGDQAFYR